MEIVVTIVQEDQILKLQCTADGHIWYSDGMETPVESPQSLSEFVDGLAARESLHVRVLGTQFNAALIVELYQKLCSPRREGRLEVASPAICVTTAECRDPKIALYRMRQCFLPPSLGGWHRFTELDYPSYAITAQLLKDRDVTEHVLRLLTTHPVYHDLQFIPDFNPKTFATLIADILDPRWFIDFEHPDRLTLLKTYLGLTPRYMWKVSRNDVTCPRTQRCMLTWLTWTGHKAIPTPEMLADNRHFLWRRWQSAGGGVKGSLRSTQAFVTYLVRTWQQQLVSKSQQQLEMFIPENLLKGSEIQAYKEHAARRPR